MQVLDWPWRDGRADCWRSLGRTAEKVTRRGHSGVVQAIKGVSQQNCGPRSFAEHPTRTVARTVGSKRRRCGVVLVWVLRRDHGWCVACCDFRAVVFCVLCANPVYTVACGILRQNHSGELPQRVDHSDIRPSVHVWRECTDRHGRFAPSHGQLVRLSCAG